MVLMRADPLAADVGKGGSGIASVWSRLQGGGGKYPAVVVITALQARLFSLFQSSFARFKLLKVYLPGLAYTKLIDAF
jgi:hypothetical protein